MSRSAVEQGAHERMAAWYPRSHHKRKAQKRGAHKQARAAAQRVIKSALL